jgi:anti-anti-sigma regulatory factor
MNYKSEGSAREPNCDFVRNCNEHPHRTLKSHASRPDTPTTGQRDPWWTFSSSVLCYGDGMDPLLEIWIDDDATPAIIRLCGVLDWTTKQSLVAFVDQLLVKGTLDLFLDAGQAKFGDATGANVLALVQRNAREAGGALAWSGVDFNHSTRDVMREEEGTR